MVEVNYAVVVASDRLFAQALRGAVAEDESGRLLVSELGALGPIYLPNEVEAIRGVVRWLLRNAANAVVVAGGTGLGPRDVSIEAVEAIATKRVPGFGEELRRRSMADAGIRALLSRADAFVVDQGIVYVIPGSPSAAKIAAELIRGLTPHVLEVVRGGTHWAR